MLNLVVKIERKHLPDDPNWADSDDEVRYHSLFLSLDL